MSGREIPSEAVEAAAKAFVKIVGKGDPENPSIGAKLRARQLLAAALPLLEREPEWYRAAFLFHTTTGDPFTYYGTSTVMREYAERDCTEHAWAADADDAWVEALPVDAWSRLPDAGAGSDSVTGDADDAEGGAE